MNQQLIFNNDFHYAAPKQAIAFSCLVSGLKVQCYIAIPAKQDAQVFLSQVIADAFTWEDLTETAIAEDTYIESGEIWL
ncbi:DUF1488 family protein [Rheinheimera sp. UJ63]|uniref:DUF1488 family protein n=1 Tax=Rheinheimera sp. UJ63 TaxID=2910157 RepID=UPI001F215BF0|nr:DUF1488 family protein [Rheinheimera sp. UJ63]MCF4008961.1 DUF1488 domain-containing protein [Rheinheimera sp. UJ63]